MNSKIYLALLVCLAMACAGSVMLDARIVSIKTADGSVWLNPDAHNGVQNINCPDTIAKMNNLCTALCSRQMLQNITVARNHHQWYLDHYDRKWYPQYEKLNDSAAFKKAQDWETNWVKFYQMQLNGCKLCEER